MVTSFTFLKALAAEGGVTPFSTIEKPPITSEGLNIGGKCLKNSNRKFRLLYRIVTLFPSLEGPLTAKIDAPTL